MTAKLHVIKKAEMSARPHLAILSPHPADRMRSQKGK